MKEQIDGVKLVGRDAAVSRVIQAVGGDIMPGDGVEDTGLDHLFFADADTGRGRLPHRRFDSRYALLEDVRPVPLAADGRKLNGEHR